MDQICIKDLEVYCHHGVLKEETVLGQKFLVSAKLFTKIEKAASSDNLEDSINYAEIAHFIEDYMKKHTYRLIEAVVENLANELLISFPLIQKVQLEIKKPWAPILLPLDTVSVEILRGWHKVYLSIGSNIGDRQKHIQDALKHLEEDSPKVRFVQASQWVETKPYGGVEQDDFINGAVELDTLLSPRELLDFIHIIEEEGNRKRDIHWGPRTIDLDIIFYDDIVMNEVDCIIPHKEMHLRSFVLEPLCEIAPWTRHPVFNKTVMQLKGECTND